MVQMANALSLFHMERALSEAQDGNIRALDGDVREGEPSPSSDI